MTRLYRFLLPGLLAASCAVVAPAAGCLAWAQPAATPVVPVTLPDSETTLLRSRTGLEYRVFVAWPDYPAPEGGYRVIYVLDANAMFLTTVEAVRAHARRGDAGPDPGALVVGIGYPPGADIGARRTWDLTVPVAEPRAKAPTGGAADFFEFIQSELKPRIERDYRVDRARQTLMGHSLAGMFATRVMTRHPDAFESYVGMSSSFWFGGHGLSGEVEAFAKARTPGDTPVRVMLLAAEFEEAVHPRAWASSPDSAAKARDDLTQRGQVTRARAAAQQLAAAPGMIVDMAEIAGEDHGSVVPAAIGRGLRFVLSGPTAVPALPSAREYMAMTPEARYQLRLDVRALPDPHRVPWLNGLKRTLHGGLAKEELELLHTERNAMDARHGTRPHLINAD
ncbi:MULTISPECIES: alpha/beta hydrolase [unclassified Luteimonas]